MFELIILLIINYTNDFSCIPSVKVSLHQPHWNELVESQLDLEEVVPH